MLVWQQIFVLYFVFGVCCGLGGYMENCSCETPNIKYPVLPDNTQNSLWMQGIPATNQQGCCTNENHVCVSTKYHEEDGNTVGVLSDFKCYPRSRTIDTTTETNANYKGDYLMLLGTNNLQSSLEECKNSCQNMELCNVFVYCDKKDGCKNSDVNVIPYQSCDLKYQFAVQDGKPAEAWVRGADVDFTSGTVVKDITCGYGEGTPCCPSDANFNMMQLGLDPSRYPGVCDASNGLYCDISDKTSGADFGVCKLNNDISNLCGTQNGLCGNAACAGWQTNCPDGYSCEFLPLHSRPGFRVDEVWQSLSYCIQNPMEGECGGDGQMCCPGIITPGRFDDPLANAHCNGGNSYCIQAEKFFSGLCWDYDLCGQTDGKCCPNLLYRVYSGNVNNRAQCKDPRDYCDNGVAGRVCRRNPDNCGEVGAPCCHQTQTCCYDPGQCNEGATCYDYRYVNGTSFCQTN